MFWHFSFLLPYPLGSKSAFLYTLFSPSRCAPTQPTNCRVMSDNFIRHPSHFQPRPSFSEHESDSFIYDQFSLGHTQTQASGLRVIMEPIPGDDRLGSNPGRPMNAKVPIPRSNYPSSYTSTSGRVSRACENCRDQKAKCSGHRPSCQRCQDSGARCSYGDRKREKMVKCVPTLHGICDHHLTKRVES